MRGAALRRLAAWSCLLLACAAGAAQAQGQGLPLSLEVRGGAAFPTGDFADAEKPIGAEPGPHFAASAAFHVVPSLALFAGYSRSSFGCANCAAGGADDRAVDSGLDFGVEGTVPLGIGGIAPWVKVGGVYHRLTFYGFDSALHFDRALGYRVGGGIALPLGALAITPGVSYGSYSADRVLLGRTRTVDVTHFTADVGLRYRF